MSDQIFVQVLDGAGHCGKPHSAVPFSKRAMLANHSAHGAVRHEVHDHVHPEQPKACISESTLVTKP